MAVIEIQDYEELDSAIAENDELVVEFGASWCSPCRKFRPFFETFAEKTGIASAYVDIDLDEQFYVQYKIQSVPQVMLFRNGEYVRHLESRTAVLLMNEVKQ